MRWTRQELEDLMDNFKADLLAYKGAYDCLQRRRTEVEGTPHEELFYRTSGCQASMHVLNMNIISTEGVIEDLKRNLDALPEDKPQLQIVRSV